MNLHVSIHDTKWDMEWLLGQIEAHLKDRDICFQISRQVKEHLAQNWSSIGI